MLQRGVEAWNPWRAAQGLDFRPDLANAFLVGAHLSGANLGVLGPV